MIYPTLTECLEECRKTGKLSVKGMSRDEYVLRKAGFRPRFLADGKEIGFFSPDTLLVTL